MLDVFCSFVIPIEVNVHSTNGTNLTSSIPILHSHISPSPLEPRSFTSTAVRKCPLANSVAVRSWCEHEIAPQVFKRFCAQELPSNTDGTNPRHQLFFEGKCTDQEICVGSNAIDQGAAHQAYCVSTDTFMHIGHNDQQGAGGSGSGQTMSVVTANFDPANKTSLAIEAVLTSSNNITSLIADSVVIQAQTYDGVFRPVAYANCLKCSSVRLAPFPEMGQRIKVDVLLPARTPVGLVWLASFLY